MGLIELRVMGLQIPRFSSSNFLSFHNSGFQLKKFSRALQSLFLASSLHFCWTSGLKFVWIPALWRPAGLSSRCEDPTAPSVASHFHLLNTLSWRMKQKWLSCFLAVFCFKELNSDLFISEEMETSQWWQIY